MSECWFLPCVVHVPTSIHVTCLSQQVKVAKIRTIIMPNIANIGRNCPLPKVITYTHSNTHTCTHGLVHVHCTLVDEILLKTSECFAFNYSIYSPVIEFLSSLPTPFRVMSPPPFRTLDSLCQLASNALLGCM